MRSMPRDRVIKSIEDIGPSEYDVTGVSSEDAKRTLHKVLYKYLGIPKDNIKMIMPMLGGSWKAIIKPKGDKSGEKSIELSKEDGNFLYFIKKMMDNKTAQELEESKIAKTTNDGSKPKLNG